MLYDCKIWLQWIIKSQNMTPTKIIVDDAEHDSVHSLPTSGIEHEPY